MKPRIVIALATYNGETYIREQLNSLLRQDYESIDIFVHDDGSKDDTAKILRSFRDEIFPRERPNSKFVIIDHPSTGGASSNFSLILCEIVEKYEEYKYFMCCDQDDIWDLDKVSISIDTMLRYEKDLSCNSPILVHTDLRLIDAHKNIMSESMFDYQNLDPRWGERDSLALTQNVVTGCTMMVNLQLLRIALPVPEEAIMHDWWFSIMASRHGKVVFIDKPTIGYRQHGGNEVGAKRFDAEYLIKKLSEIHKGEMRQKTLFSISRQAQAIVKMEEEKLLSFKNKGRDPAIELSGITKKNIIERKIIILRGKFYKIGWQRNAAWILLA